MVKWKWNQNAARQLSVVKCALKTEMLHCKQIVLLPKHKNDNAPIKLLMSGFFTEWRCMMTDLSELLQFQILSC